MRNFLVETEACEPAPRQVHAQFLNQFALAADAIQIANQQNAQQQFWVDRRTASIAIAVLQLLVYEAEVDVLIDQPQEMVLWNLIFNSEVVEQRFRARVLTHHERSSSDNGHPKTAWSHYAAKQLLWPYRLHRNQLIRTEFFNTHS
jgi:hypothetical protein